MTRYVLKRNLKSPVLQFTECLFNNEGCNSEIKLLRIIVYSPFFDVSRQNPLVEKQLQEKLDTPLTRCNPTACIMHSPFLQLSGLFLP